MAFCFAHDRIQHAAYRLLTSDTAAVSPILLRYNHGQSAHVKIAKFLENRSPSETYNVSRLLASTNADREYRT